MTYKKKKKKKSEPNDRSMYEKKSVFKKYEKKSYKRNIEKPRRKLVLKVAQMAYQKQKNPIKNKTSSYRPIHRTISSGYGKGKEKTSSSLYGRK